MCSPEVMSRVHASIRKSGGTRLNRRNALMQAGGLAAAGALAPVFARAQATPVAEATPIAGACIAFSTVINLSHENAIGVPVWPGNPEFEIEVATTLEADGFYTNILTYQEHTGTHMDAPAHFMADGITAEQIAPQSLVAPLVVVDVTDAVAGDEDYALAVSDLEAWEAEYGEIPAGALVAMRSGWSDRFGDAPSFVNADSAGVMHFPGFSPEAAAFLVEQRTIVGVASDTLSQDPGNSTDFGTHITILGAGLYGLEGVANLGDVPDSGAWVVVGSPNHVGASGGPTRLLALA